MNFANLFSFSGRVGRLEYWATHFSLMFVITLTAVLQHALPVHPAVSGLLALPLNIALAWGGWALSAKRLHDTGRSLWWFLGYLAIGIVGLVTLALVVPVLNADALAPGATAIPLLVMLIGAIGYLVWAGIGLWVLGIKGSDAGANKYGVAHSGSVAFAGEAGEAAPASAEVEPAAVTLSRPE